MDKEMESAVSVLRKIDQSIKTVKMSSGNGREDLARKALRWGIALEKEFAGFSLGVRKGAILEYRSKDSR